MTASDDPVIAMERSGRAMFDLTGRVVVVTGAGRGLGQMMASALADAGASVVLLGRKEPALERTRDEVNGATGNNRAEYLVCDVTDEASVHDVARRVGEMYGRVDCVVNNAGVTWGEPIESVSVERWNRVFATNLTGTVLVSRAFRGLMLKQPAGGSVICVSSVTGVRGVPYMQATAYSASKAAVEQFAREAAMEWASDSIRVNTLRLGFFETRMMTSFFELDAKESESLDMVPLGRLGTAADISGVAIFLASDASRYLTGSTLTVDGGLLARLGPRA